MHCNSKKEDVKIFSVNKISIEWIYKDLQLLISILKNILINNYFEQNNVKNEQNSE